ncbi:hypothetical protein BDU57DRAFT_13358 [Ampelomyces quisqualis]|uniref:Uncharacterized protein n=1 Tax=Ampelomyces quisqualis TaxID=50730 RepID=A0A6A5QYA8_AMPQU|nr:hypothetical protein BDU57DRAFT_13358 [Ampelomyces quisqualis]
MALYLLASEGSCRRTFGVKLAPRAQKHGSGSTITRSTQCIVPKHPCGFTSSRQDYFSAVAGVQGWLALRQPYKDTGLEQARRKLERLTKPERNGPTRGPWIGSHTLLVSGDVGLRIVCARLSVEEGHGSHSAHEILSNPHDTTTPTPCRAHVVPRQALRCCHAYGVLGIHPAVPSSWLITHQVDLFSIGSWASAHLGPRPNCSGGAGRALPLQYLNLLECKLKWLVANA